MKKLLMIENYILKNGTNVTNEKLQGLLFFSILAAFKEGRGAAKGMINDIVIKDNHVFIKSSYLRYKDYGSKAIPRPDETLEINFFYKVTIDAILDTYDQFSGEQITQLVRDSGLLDNVDNSQLFKRQVKYYLDLEQSSEKYNKEHNIYNKDFFFKAKVGYGIVMSVIIITIILLIKYSLSSIENSSELTTILQPINLFFLFATIIVIFTADSKLRCHRVIMIMKVEKEKLKDRFTGVI